MRRKEREITDRSEIDAVIGECKVCRIGLGDVREPYIVPLFFGYDGEALYVHSAGEGRKIDLLRRQPRVAFEMDVLDAITSAPTACGWSGRYRSVMGSGTAEFLEDRAAKERALDLIMRHYTEGTFTYAPASVDRCAVIRLRIETISGKRA